jgi:hypothetical protein
MSWNHLLCEPCWKKREPERVPVRVRLAPENPCCECGKATASGTYVRQNPAQLLCEGQGPTHADDD